MQGLGGSSNAPPVTRVHPRSVDPDRVVIIYNSNAVALADSLEIAEYYCDKRGLKKNLIGIDFGTKTGGTYNAVPSGFADVVQPVAAATLGADAVLCSAFVPFKATVNKSGADAKSANMAMANLLQYAGFYANYVGDIPDVNSYCHSGDLSCSTFPSSVGTTFDSLWGEFLTTYPEAEDYIQTWNRQWNKGGQFWRDSERRYFAAYKDNPFWKLGGRIGAPTVGGYTETVADVKRMIDDAVVNEQSIVSAISNGLVFQIGCHDRVAAADIDCYQALDCEGSLYDAGFTKFVNVQGYVGTTNFDAISPDPVGIGTSAAEMMGTATVGGCFSGTGNLSPRRNLWGHLDQAICNATTQIAGDANHWAESFNIQAGAWGAYPTSAGVNPAVSLLVNGGCASIGTVAEPLSNGVVFINAVIREALTGSCMAEIAMFNKHVGGWHNTCFGDPLYAPFGKEPNTSPIALKSLEPLASVT